MPPLRVLIADVQPSAETLGVLRHGARAPRLLRPLPACPVTVLTAAPSPEDGHRARNAGACVPPPAAETPSEAA